MKYYILFALTILCFFLQAQSFRADLLVTDNTGTPANGGDFAITGLFEDNDGLGFSDSNIKLDTTVFADNRGYRYRVVYKSGAVLLDLEVDAIDTLTAPMMGYGQLYDPTPNFSFPIETGGNIVDKNRASLTTKFREDLDTLLAGFSSGATILFDSDRPVGRVPELGTNIGGSTILDWLEYWYFTVPTATLTQAPSTSIFEVGDSMQLIYSWTISNPSSATLSNGQFRVTSPLSLLLTSFSTSTSGADTIQYAPTQGSTSEYERLSYSLRVQQDWTNGTESSTLYSSTKTIQGVYPVFVGLDSTDYTASGNIYIEPNFTKLVEVEGSKTVSLTGSGYIYYCMPSTWADTNITILDANDFDVTASFDRVTNVSVTSTGLTNNWTQTYVVYKLKTYTAAAAFDYKFNQ